MAAAPVLLRLISSSIAIANHAGNIIRDVMTKGELGIVEKVAIYYILIVNHSFLLFFKKYVFALGCQ